MKIVNVNTLRDTLYYLSPESGVNEERATGALIGVVASFMSLGLSFQEAIGIVKDNLPKDANKTLFPESWRNA